MNGKNAKTAKIATRNAEWWRNQIDRFGLRVYCVRCQARGRFYPTMLSTRYRLREVACARVLSDGETVCGGRFRVRPRDSVARDWPGTALAYTSPQGELFAPVRGDC